jgi:hypothetical protein
VRVRVGPDGPLLTGLEPARGETETEYWVRDGMLFVLVAEQGQELARAAARIDCAASQDRMDQALAQGSWFPLEVGNVWVYRANSRASTGEYFVRTVTRRVEFGGQFYFAVTSGNAESYYREDATGQVWEYDVATLREKLYLDPSGQPGSGASIPLLAARFGLTNELGVFPEAANYNVVRDGLLRDTGQFVRGVGLVSRTAFLLTGSSGGFTDGYELIAARLGPYVQLGRTLSAFSLHVESERVPVSARRARNCAVPCYFVACGLAAPPVDPPGAYKPCLEARMEAPPGELELTLESGGEPAGIVIWRRTVAHHTGLSSFNVPLYRGADPLPLGAYQLKMRAGNRWASRPLILE